MKKQTLLAIALAVGLSISIGATSHTYSVPETFTPTPCEQLDPFLKTLSAEITEVPSGHQFLTIVCYID